MGRRDEGSEDRKAAGDLDRHERCAAIEGRGYTRLGKEEYLIAALKKHSKKCSTYDILTSETNLCGKNM